VPYEMPQDSRSATYKAQADGEPVARPPANAVTKQAQNAGPPAVSAAHEDLLSLVVAQ
jgi:hypothetical protein